MALFKDLFCDFGIDVDRLVVREAPSAEDDVSVRLWAGEVVLPLERPLIVLSLLLGVFSLSLADEDIPDMDMRRYHFLSLSSFLSGGRAVDSSATPFAGALKPNWRSMREPTLLGVAIGDAIGEADGNDFRPGAEAGIDPELEVSSSSSSSLTPFTVLTLFRVAEATGTMGGACP